MGQEPTPITTTGQEPAAAGQEPTPAANGNGAEPQTFPREYVEKLRSEAAEARLKAKEANERAQKYEDANKTESEKLNERATKAEKEAADARSALLRIKVGQAKGLPLEVAELLHGDDEKAMNEHADRLLKAGIQAATTPTFDGGARPSTPQPQSMDAAIRAAAGRG